MYDLTNLYFMIQYIWSFGAGSICSPSLMSTRHAVSFIPPRQNSALFRNTAKSCVCHRSAKSARKSFACHTCKIAVCKPFVYHTSETPHPWARPSRYFTILLRSRHASPAARNFTTYAATSVEATLVRCLATTHSKPLARALNHLESTLIQNRGERTA